MLHIIDDKLYSLPSSNSDVEIPDDIPLTDDITEKKKVELAQRDQQPSQEPAQEPARR